MVRAILVLTAALAFGVGAGAASSSTQQARWFHSPTKNIFCELHVSRPTLGTSAFCWARGPAGCVTLNADGTTRAPQNCLISDEPQTAFTLRYGRSVGLGPFRCTSRRVGMRCVVARSGHGFAISRRRLTRF